MIHPTDTDAIVITILLSSVLWITEIWVAAYGHVANMINLIVVLKCDTFLDTRFGHELSHLFMHAVSGCNTASAFYERK